MKYIHYVLQVKLEWTKTVMIYGWKKVIRLRLYASKLWTTYILVYRVCEALSRWCGAGRDRKVAHTQGIASHITNVDDGKLSFLVYLFYLIHQSCNTWVDLKMCYVCLSNKTAQWNSRCGIGFVNGLAVIGHKTGHSLQWGPTLGDFLDNETSVVTAHCFRNHISFYITVHFEDTNWPWNGSNKCCSDLKYFHIYLITTWCEAQASVWKIACSCLVRMISANDALTERVATWTGSLENGSLMSNSYHNFLDENSIFIQICCVFIIGKILYDSAMIRNIMGIDHDTVCAGVVGTAIRHNECCAE